MKIMWAIKWHIGVMWDAGFPCVFETRKKAREYADLHYGYIKTRKDLRAAPFHWRMPKAVKVRVNVIEVRIK